MGGRMMSGVSLKDLLQSILITSSTVSPWDDVLIPENTWLINLGQE